MKEQIQESMELARSDEQNYQLELRAYWIIFPDFKYEPPSFIFVDIGTSRRAPTTPFVVQHVAITKPINPLKGGTSLEIIPLPIQTFTILVQIATIVNELVKGNERSTKEPELVDPSFIILNNKVESL